MPHKLDELLDGFRATMKWSPETGEHERSLVECNLNGFVAYAKAELAKDAAISLRDHALIDAAWQRHIGSRERAGPGAPARAQQEDHPEGGTP